MVTATGSDGEEREGSEPVMVVENCEEELSDWLLSEYRHCAELWPGTVFTKVKRKQDRRIISDFAVARQEDALTFTGGRGCIILDHKAEKTLTRSEMFSHRYLIVGGILGYDRPLGRTAKLITRRFDPRKNITRNMGTVQMTIDSAVFVARAMLLGASLKDIEITERVEVKWDDTHSTILPYGYPLIDGRVIITPGLLDVLSKGWGGRGK
ncbi:MAG: hypothetical protein KIY12_00455 [Thermoplasmata archaeon]|uniref:Uncharacterized protein n=1 Tax=Candidatus Sysuiplasma superficiale TaxID=2823368 RepID=A0A8J7YLX1_9ARCH|nr:hypothetical protein [Candidatus Sysuiplasma superficiale]MBX8643195.1 hypothetical protein [Candidatus Sysuiplasma superficiale]MCL4346720.1 hypothetical protein [Candidatus Thermoplasmatota archaeon]MCL5437225.1 hypothetical protein [Candidatus Thermoplasmatota archaeon]